jgi:hypothetical protein
VDFRSGQLRLDMATVTDGKIVARGDGKVVNDVSGDHLPSGAYGSLELVNETAWGLMIQDMWELQGLDPDRPLTVTPTSRNTDGVTQTITGDPATSVVVQRG